MPAHRSVGLACLLLLAAALRAEPAPLDPSLFRELAWRHVGPFRGGRTKAATGVPGRRGVFLIGAVNGGVFRSDDQGRTWAPTFDDQPTASIGAIAVAPSDPEVVYVGSGEGMHRPDLSTGDGVYKSVDGGRSWRHLGLSGAQQIPQIAVDPRDARRLFVAVLGHPYGPSEERGLFRSADGGATFEKVLYLDPETGAADVVIDPSDPRTVYASLWEAREAPWENGRFQGPGSGLYKSGDGGTTWRRLEHGLPGAREGLGRIGLGIAPSRPSRLYATVGARSGGGLYRSDDAGESWTCVNDDPRVTDRADDAAEVKVHPNDPDVVFSASIVLWKSVDGGRTFGALRGAPGGDDYQRVWIDPAEPETMIVASDQGAIVTVNGGRSWSSWYNQPTAQLFKVTADAAFPYRLCGGQQESGSACVPSRGPGGSITFRDWSPAGFDEYGQAAPDPLDPDVVYGARVERWDRRTGQRQEVGPVAGSPPGYRVLRTQPLLFSPTDPRTLFFASNVLWSTRDGGRTWAQRSPDLARPAWEVPANVGKYRAEVRPSRRGVIYALAPSPRDPGTIWAGTDDGLLHVTRDGGKRWRDVTPPLLKPWMKVAGLAASHQDPATAWAAVNTLRLDDLNPHLLRTRDGGASWTETVAGLPAGEVVNVVREDPRRAGLLYAGTERGVHVSFDGGDRWLPLRQDLPATSVRDLVVKDDDLAIATHGRGFWILDDASPLRELGPAALAGAAHLFRPARATRVRWSLNTDTPLPPDEPAAQNPPDGATLHYWLARRPAGPVAIELLDTRGALLRRFASDDPAAPPADEGHVPRYWMRPARPPSAEPGLHRFVWDLHLPPPAALRTGFSMAAVPGETPRGPLGPWVLPGRYQVRLTVDGQRWTQPFELRMDPRVRATAAALRLQYDLSVRVVRALEENRAALAEVRARRAALEGSAAPEAPALRARLEALEGSGGDRRGPPGRGERPQALAPQNSRLVELLERLQEADAAPPPVLVRAVEAALREGDALSRSLAALPRVD